MKIKYLFSSIIGGVVVYFLISVISIFSVFIWIGGMFKNIQHTQSEDKIVQEFGAYLNDQKAQELVDKTKKTIFNGPLQTISVNSEPIVPTSNQVGLEVVEYIQAKENEEQLLQVKSCLKAFDDQHDDLVALIITNLPRSVYS